MLTVLGVVLHVVICKVVKVVSGIKKVVVIGNKRILVVIVNGSVVSSNASVDRVDVLEVNSVVVITTNSN